MKDRATAGDRTAAALFQTVGEKFATGRFDFQPEGERKISIGTGYDRRSKDRDGKRVDGTQTPTDSIWTGKEEVVTIDSEHPGYKSAIGKRKETSATQWSDAVEGKNHSYIRELCKNYCTYV